MTELLMTILLRHCEDLPGEWNAFCPKLGIMTQGTGIQEATDMIQDAILLSLGEDGLEGLPTGDHSEEWKLIRQVMKDGKPLDEYVGGYDDWLRQSIDNAKKEVGVIRGKTADKNSATSSKVNKAKKLSYKDQRELDALPAQIESFENEVESLQNRMADEAFYKQQKDEILKVQKQLEDARDGLEHCYTRWEALEQ